MSRGVSSGVQGVCQVGCKGCVKWGARGVSSGVRECVMWGAGCVSCGVQGVCRVS